MLEPRPPPRLQMLTTGCAVMDSCLRGGIPTRMVTEFYGCAGTGKTQLCLQLCVTVQQPVALGGLDAGECLSDVLRVIPARSYNTGISSLGAIYMSTEHSFASDRFMQIAQSQAERLKGMHPQACHLPTPSPSGSTGAPSLARNPGDYVYVFHVEDLETQIHYMDYQFPALMQQHKIRLIVIDSIASNLRFDDSIPLDAAPARAELLYKIGQTLKRLADQFDAAVVCVNQATALLDNRSFVTAGSFGRAYAVDYPIKMSIDPNNTPALGLAWANNVNVRILLARRDGSAEGGGYGSRFERALAVVFAPYVESGGCRFVITSEGVRGVERMSIDF